MKTRREVHAKVERSPQRSKSTKTKPRSRSRSKSINGRRRRSSEGVEMSGREGRKRVHVDDGINTGSSCIAAMAIVFHLCAFASIFDIYFRSPIVSGLEAVPAPEGAPAKRIVVFIADGARADMFFQVYNGSALAHYLREKILSGTASWGVSHTRVPTESRPCHASIFGGIYEDPSAVTAGWQHNPVEFDTVINASSAAFAFGSPDVIPLFAKGLPHVTSETYPAEWEDFSSGCNSTDRGCRVLDDWVFSRLAALLDSAAAAGDGHGGEGDGAGRNGESEVANSAGEKTASGEGLNRAEEAGNAGALGDAKELSRRLRGEGVVIFLHLLGLDMNGHAHRPASEEYRDNIRSVDEGVRDAAAMVEEFYGRDGRTAFIVTADHGMSNKGSHGDGEPECTQTPLVAWGAGVARSPVLPRPAKAGGGGGEKTLTDGGHGGVSSDPAAVAKGHSGPGAVPSTPEAWGELVRVERRDIEQAQLAPLMSALIGAHIPRNNIATLPLNYLDDDASPAGSRRGGQAAGKAPAAGRLRKSQTLAANVEQMLRQLERKALLKLASSLSIFFRPYAPSKDDGLRVRLRSLQELITAGKLAETESEAHELLSLVYTVDAVSKGLDYYNKYDRGFLQAVIVLSYIGGMACLLLYATRSTGAGAVGPWPSHPALIAAGACSTILVLQGSPAQYHLYVWWAVYLWDRAMAAAAEGFVGSGLIFRAGSWKSIVWGLAGASILELMVLGFFQRSLYTLAHIVLALAAFLLPSESMSSVSLKSKSVPSPAKARSFGWVGTTAASMRPQLLFIAASIVTSGFTLLSVEFGDAPVLVFAGGAAMLLSVVLAAACARAESELAVAQVLSSQAALIAIGMVSLWTSMRSLEAKAGLPTFAWAANWAILLLSLAAPFAATARTRRWEYRLLSLFVGWGTPYMLLSINYEGCFLWAMGVQLFAWALLENERRRQPTARPPEALGAHDAVTALVFLFLVTGSFFGTGNIASVSSFELRSIYRFIYVFNAWLMGLMLLFKIALPFVLVSATFVVICRLHRVPTARMLCVTLAIADVMSLHFFFMVRTEGSWKEIGASISQFGISNFIIVMVQLLLLATRPIAAGIDAP